MIEFNDTRGLTRISSQPIALAAAVLVALVIGAGSIALWRGYTGTSPEADRVIAARHLQVRAAQAEQRRAARAEAGRERAAQARVRREEALQARAACRSSPSSAPSRS